MYSRLSKPLGLAFVFACFAAAQPQYFVTTVAGGAVTPTPVAALSAALVQPQRVTVDQSGNVYFTASNAVFKLSNGSVTLVAGTGHVGYSGDGGPALQAQFNSPQGIAVDSSQNIYVADTNNHLIRIITTDGKINVYAGDVVNGVPSPGWTGDGGAPIGAQLDLPVGICLDKSGNLYIADSANNAIREVSEGGGFINTIAGLGPQAAGFGGDTTAAIGANLNAPLDVAVDSNGNVYIADTNNANVREITASTGIINTIAGSTAIVSGALQLMYGYAGDGGLATSAELAGPAGVAVDSKGNLYIATYADNRIRVVNSAGNTTVSDINTFAGNSAYGFSGDGGPATSAQLSSPRGIALDSSGNLYLADRWNNRIRKIAGGTISTIAGSGAGNFGGDGGSPTASQLNAPGGLAVASNGAYYISDTLNNRVRMVAGGVITTVAGNGVAGFSGDGGAATSAQLNVPSGLALDTAGNLYIADASNSVVRKVTPQGVISTFAGQGGVAGYSGDGGPAAKATMIAPVGLAVDSAGNVYVADYFGWIREVNASTGNISTIAGTGGNGYTGDGGMATSAMFYNPVAVAVDNSGNVYVADSNNGVVREIASNGIITTIAGIGTLGYSGDGGPAAVAQFSLLTGIAVDPQGNVYLADSGNEAIRLFPLNGVVSTIAGNGNEGYTGDGGPATVATFNNPSAVAVDRSGNVYVSDTSNNAVRLLTRQ